MESLFCSIDTDSSGSLSLSEVINYLKSLTDDISDENVKTFFDGLDTSGDKKVDLDEFNVKESEIRALFNYIDKDKSGFISLEVNIQILSSSRFTPTPCQQHHVSGQISKQLKILKMPSA